MPDYTKEQIAHMKERLPRILSEVVEASHEKLWSAVKKDDLVHAKTEAIQVAAMAIAFILEVEK